MQRVAANVPGLIAINELAEWYERQWAEARDFKDELLEDYAYHLRYKALVICPAALQKMWNEELLSAGIAARIVTQEILGREEYDIHEVMDADIVLVDESHNFRNRNAQRYDNLERILAGNRRRIESEDGRVVEEQESFVELVSSEFLLQNLKGLLDNEMRQLLDELPDGIHSGLLREDRRGVFFYFTAQRKGRGSLLGGGREHYWRYVDITDNAQGGAIEDNRYRITNLIQCQPDTVRVVPTSIEVDIFALQERVIESVA